MAEEVSDERVEIADGKTLEEWMAAVLFALQDGNVDLDVKLKDVAEFLNHIQADSQTIAELREELERAKRHRDLYKNVAAAQRDKLLSLQPPKEGG